MFERFGKVVKKVAPYVFRLKNNNAVKMVSGLLTDAVTTTINIGAPLIIANHFSKQNNNPNQKDEESMSDAQFQQIVLIGCTVALAVAQALPRIRSMMVNSVRANVQKELTLSMVEKCYDLELDHHLTTRTGEFAQALSKNYSSIDKGLPSLFNEIFPITLEVVGTSAVLTAKYGYIGLCQLGILTAFLAYATYGENSAEEIRKQCVDMSYRAYGIVIEAINNYQIAHQFGNVSHEITKVDTSLKSSEDLYSKVHRKDDINSLILSTINSAGFIGTLVLAALKPPSGQFVLIDFALIAYYMTRFNARLDALPQSISNIHTAIIDAERIANLLERRSLVADPNRPRILNTNYPLDIEFVNVSFSYDSKEILNNVSFRAKPGQKVAIVGPTGAGKSTIIKLLLRFYKPSSGNILINGQDIAYLSAESLRAQIAVVSQDSILFSGTIAENIKYGDLSAPDEDIVQVARFAELIHDNTEKLQTNVGQNGNKLSGGEKQRTAIARALIKGGLLFLLDEPTSALDPKTEAEVQQLLDGLTATATTLVVTHRLNTIINADQIIYLDGTRIVETGSFEELIGRRDSNFYKQFCVQCNELGIHPESVRPNRRQTDITARYQQFWRQRQDKKVQQVGHAIAIHGTEEEHDDGAQLPLLPPNAKGSVQSL